MYPIKLLTFISIILFCTISLWGQQCNNINLSIQNPFLINPSLAGNHLHTQFNLHYKKQWSNIDGAPETVIFTADWRDKINKNGFGLIIHTDKTGIINQSLLHGAYSRTTKLLEKHYFKLGIFAGITQNTINYNEIRANNPYETILFQNVKTSSKLNVNFGSSYFYRNIIKIGFCANHLTGNNYSYIKRSYNNTLVFRKLISYTTHLHFKKQIHSKGLQLETVMIMKSSRGLPMQYNVKIALEKIQFGCLGLYISQKYESGLILGTYINDNMKFSMALNIPIRKFSTILGNSYEMAITYNLQNSYNKKEQRQKTNINETSIPLTDAIRRLSERNDKIEQEYLRIQTKIHNLDSCNIQSLKSNKSQIDTIYVVMDTKANDVQSKIDTSERKKTIKKKSKTYFVISGAFRKNKTAKIFQNQLKAKLKCESTIIKNAINTYYFISIKETKSIEEAKKYIAKFNLQNTNELINGELWIYCIESL